MPDPKLKAAAEEIKAVLRKYDLAALITLQGPRALEFVREISPSWSCAKIEETPRGPAIRVRAKLAEFASPAAQKECLEQTVGMIIAFEHQANDDAQNMRLLIEVLSTQFSQITNFLRED